MDRRALRELLASRGLKPRKRFGQHFLLDRRTNRELVAAAGVGEGDVVLEIGPGTGALTEEILSAGAHVLAVEIDRGLASLVEERLGGGNPGGDRLRILCCDALASKHRLAAEMVEALSGLVLRRGRPGFRWVSNLPYNAATPLIVEILSLASPALLKASVTIQSEVAERLTASPGTREYGPVSVQVQLRSRVAILRRIPPGAFWPSPNVDSAAIVLEPKARPALPPSFSPFAASLFAHRRKTLGRCLAHATGARVSSKLWSVLGLGEMDRVENLDPGQILALHDTLATEGVLSRR